MVLHIPTPQRDLGMRAANWRSGRVVAVHCRCLDGASLVLLPSGSGNGRHLCRSFARSLARSLSLVDGTHAGGSLPMRDLVRLSLALRRRLRRWPCLLLCCPPPPAVVRSSVVCFGRSFARCCCCCCFVAQGSVMYDSYLVDPASSHMLVSKIKPCMSKHKPLHGEAANGSLGHP